MKRFTLLLIISNLLFVQHLFAAKSIWDGRSSDTSWYNDTSSEYHINSAAQFKGFADLVSYNYCSFEGKTIYLECDVDLDNHPWSPIGLHSGKPFYGIFDGLNHSITNLLIDSNQFEYPDMKDNVGLFGYAAKAEIKNLGVQGKLEIYEGKYIGGVAAFVNRIDNIYSDIVIKINWNKSASSIGCVVGNATELSSIYSKGEISCGEGMFFDQVRVGGIAGNGRNITKCYSDVNISIKRIGTYSTSTGGIAGYSSSISDVIFTGSVSEQNVNCTSDQFIPFTAGICGGFSGDGKNMISAPRLMAFGRGWASGKSVLIPSANTANITNSYYVNTWATNSEVYGTSITENELKSGNPLPGFDTTTWVFNENEYPSLISLKSLIPQPTYTVTYYVDGLLYQVDEYKEGDAVVPPADPIKEGYTFDGWGYVPPVISGNSWIVYGSFSINSYVITYMIDDEVFLTETQEYNSYINPPKYYPIKQGYLFNWGEYPYNVPAHDVTIVGYYTEDFYECVDLGLPSGLLWATKNVGAANSESSGYYFSWGETYLKESYYWGTYEYCNGSANTLMKYCYSSDYGIVDNKLTLDEDDDAARVSWGSPWRLPTENEALELYNSCSWSLGSLNGVNGCYVTGPNGNSIFFPYAGIKQYQTTLKGGSEMYLLTSSLYHYDDIRPDYGIVVFCDGSEYGLGGEERGYGFTARAVTNIDPNGIRNLILSDSNEIDVINDLQGKRLSKVKKGVNIIRTKDGKTKKVVVK